MTQTKSTLFVALIALAVALTACSKKEEAPAEEPAAAAEEPKAEEPKAEEPMAEEPAKEMAEEGGDYVKVVAMHEPAKDGDPVVVAVKGVEVASAEFDPANLEGATATLLLDLNTIDSGSEKRDAHLKSPDFLDIAKLPKIEIKISDVKKGDADGAYTAKAALMDKTMDVTFEVVETMDNAIKVKGMHKFNRTDLGIGAPPSADVPVAAEVTVEMMLTLSKGA